MNVEQVKKLGTSLGHAISLALLLASAVADAQGPPIGYERLALHGHSEIESGVFEKKSISFVYNNYEKQLVLSGVTPNDVQVSDKRLLDIEVHVSGGSKPKMEISGIWIENEGYYYQESWLTLDLTASDLIDWPLKGDLIPVDIERYYTEGEESFYAVLWQSNRHGVDWDVRLEVDSEDILRRVDEGYRVVDFDQFRSHYKHPPEGSEQYFDAILVENSGNNYLNAVWKPIFANPLDTLVIKNNFDTEPEIIYPKVFPGFATEPETITTRYEGFNIFDDEKIVDVEFVEFPESFPDAVFPDTWALVISHPVPECRSVVSEGVLSLVAGVASYDAEHDVGRVIDYEGTAPFQNQPKHNPNWYGHNGKLFGPPGFAFRPTYIHGCKRIIPY